METLEKYQKDLLNLFYMSVDNDIENWNYFDQYERLINLNSDEEPVYFTSTDFKRNCRFVLNIKHKKLYWKKEYEEVLIAKYHIFENINIFRNIKIWIYSKKLIYKYRSIKKQSKDLYVINNLKEAISIIEPVYIKEIRKEKLKNIKS